MPSLLAKKITSLSTVSVMAMGVLRNQEDGLMVFGSWRSFKILGN